MLRREGLVVNLKRTYRLCTQQGLQIRTKKHRELSGRDRAAGAGKADAKMVLGLRQ